VKKMNVLRDGNVATRGKESANQAKMDYSGSKWVKREDTHRAVDTGERRREGKSQGCGRNHRPIAQIVRKKKK